MKKIEHRSYYEDEVSINNRTYEEANLYSMGSDVTLSLRKAKSEFFIAFGPSSVSLSFEDWRKVVPKLLAFIQEVEVEEGKL
jgi:hypothetical protein